MAAAGCGACALKRFWRDAEAVACDDGWTVALDGKRLRTPARAPLVVPTPALAGAIAAEWNAQADEVRPAAMGLTGLANAAIDRAGPALAASIAAFGETDLLCYRAEAPPALVERQAAEWDPPLEWARRRYDVAFAVGHGIAHRPQPAPTLARLTAAVMALSPFTLAGLHPIVTITGSLVLGLAVHERALDPDAAFAAGELDALWQAEHWGEVDTAADVRTARRAELLVGARLLDLLA